MAKGAGTQAISDWARSDPQQRVLTGLDAHRDAANGVLFLYDVSLPDRQTKDCQCPKIDVGVSRTSFVTWSGPMRCSVKR
ncbi:hypothetical protein DV20_32295 [Amycolatopsis rifamycinica]|uniref:Uncharacterized protein n=1 Tax=Amycolatopsis rifamycinica TaxID=287986 RepID=A0A066U1A9_9PSEU|nr:hypothetical protein DV20_32295 [Amycolatopsis rifamycinica]